MNHFGAILALLIAIVGQLVALLGLSYRSGRKSAQLQDSVEQATRDIAALRTDVSDDLGKVNDRLTWLERTTHQTHRARWGHWN
ncbi:MAG TPA: hypothetical protein VGG50_11455 [Streptosporangiaceae bacterium]